MRNRIERKASWRKGLEVHLEEQVGMSRAEGRESLRAEGGGSRT